MSEDPTLDCNRTNADLQAAAYSLCPSIFLHTGEPNKRVCERMIEILTELRKRAALNELRGVPDFDDIEQLRRDSKDLHDIMDARKISRQAALNALLVVIRDRAKAEAQEVLWASENIRPFSEDVWITERSGVSKKRSERGAPTPFAPLTVGERLVPKDTPNGPPEARIAWADAQQELLVVVKSQTATQEAVVVGWMLPRGGRVVTEKIAEKYERADGRPIA